MIERIAKLIALTIVSIFYLLLWSLLAVCAVAMLLATAVGDLHLASLYLAGCAIYVLVWIAKRNAHRIPSWVIASTAEERESPIYGTIFLGLVCIGTGIGLLVATVLHLVGEEPLSHWFYLGGFALVFPVVTYLLAMLHQMVFGEVGFDDSDGFGGFGDFGD